MMADIGECPFEHREHDIVMNRHLVIDDLLYHCTTELEQHMFGITENRAFRGFEFLKHIADALLQGIDLLFIVRGRRGDTLGVSLRKTFRPPFCKSRLHGFGRRLVPLFQLDLKVGHFFFQFEDAPLLFV